MKTGYLFLASLCFILACSALYLYSCIPSTYLLADQEIKKLFTIETPIQKVEKIIEAAKIDTIPTYVVPKDTTQLVYSAVPEPILPDSSVDDSTQHRILLIGDSEAGGMKNVLNDYCQSNGHKLVAAYAWQGVAFTQRSLDALRKASTTSYFKAADALWVKLVSAGDDSRGMGGGVTVPVSR